MGYLQLLQHLHILVNVIVTITSNIAVVTVVYSQRSMGKLVPYTQALSMGSPAPFNLKCKKSNIIVPAMVNTLYILKQH